MVVFGLAVWPGRAVTYEQVSQVESGEVSEGAGLGDLQAGPQRVGSGRILFALA